jgi:hypothetical protein
VVGRHVLGLEMSLSLSLSLLLAWLFGFDAKASFSMAWVFSKSNGLSIGLLGVLGNEWVVAGREGMHTILRRYCAPTGRVTGYGVGRCSFGWFFSAYSVCCANAFTPRPSKRR